MSQTLIETLLESKIGISVDAIGSKVIEKAVNNRIAVCGLADARAYFQYVRGSEQEWNELVESVVIPETWFFRSRQSFLFLEQYVMTEWKVNRQENPLRVLSIPCSTGEEPYSIAITLFEAGLQADRFRIDAVDISEKALQKAKQGNYGEESFRNKETLDLRDRYFEKKMNTYRIQADVKKPIRFLQGNLLDPTFLNGEKLYDVVFCRNLLIYLGQQAKKQAVAVLSRVLAKTGILFVGHAERSVFDTSEFDWVRQIGVFACRRVKSGTQPKKRIFPKLQYTFERRKSRQRSEQRPAKDPGVASPGKSPVKAKSPAAPVVERRRPSEIVLDVLDKARQLADQGELKEALALCEEGLRESPTDVQANFLTGLIWLALGEDEQAEKFFSKTVYLNPKHQEALNYLAFIAEYRGDHEKVRLLRQRIARIQKQPTEDECLSV